ncbi:ATP-binding protein [Gayadomonas joobiniege]|uniref:ATP-binding protein n=1 Tax=Gayadomonas joobiniege TaxID=1234606 RepID=UPI00035C7F8F|nr:ATP-binding protein [Gayadomonas joobiniege]
MRVLRQFHNISTNQSLTFKEKADQLLVLGLQIFDLDIGIISKIENSVYFVEYVACHNNEVEVGTQFDVENTYCVHTLNAGHALYFNQASTSEIARHPCYQEFKLESYIGAPIIVDNNIYGTVNFSAVEPSQTFSEESIDYIELFALWLGSELARLSYIQQLRKQSQSLNKLESVANIGTWEVNLLSNTIYWSPKTKALHQVAPDYQPNLEQAVNFFPEDGSRERITAAVEEGINNGTPWNLEVKFIGAKGKHMWVCARGQAEFVNGECVRLFGTFQDVSESVALRAKIEQQKNDAEFLLLERTQLIAKISHEIRTPLNGIIGMLVAALDKQQDPQQLAKKLKVALRSSDVLLSIVNDVLDFSKIHHGELKLEYAHFPLKRVFADVTSLFMPLAINKNLNFKTELKIDNECYVYSDPTRLSQIISNLLSNAIKFTESGTVVLTANVSKKNDFHQLTFSVQDSGIGMQTDTLNSLFKPFSQGNDNITARFGGTGLGLSIVKELLDMMDGDIQVTTTYGHGSNFSVKLKLPQGHGEKTLSIKQKVDDELLVGAAKLSTLVVDDNEINRLVLEASLQKFNIQCDFAVDGLDAYNKCKQNIYDLVFMDSVMPEMTGPEAAKAIRTDALLPPHAKIVALSANTSEADKLECRNAGMDIFLSKPIQQPKLAQAILAVILNKQKNN